ncbi:hypothetical protein BS78_06G055100 [Paspalum vaginatum]|nr:hypothetical protein BS78_06G055100 [Paspalum vaginatum]
MAMTAAAKTVLLLLVLVQLLAVLAKAARPLAETADGWFETGGGGGILGMLRAAKSGPNPISHCC